MLAIHDSPNGFHPRWIAHCESNDIEYRLVSCYSSTLISDLEGCRGLLWHHSQSDPRDILIARQILFSLEHAGLHVFPDFRTAWHFDDKVAQKYLFEALDIPAVPAHVFVNRNEALAWVDQSDFPKVFKLRRGAGSAGVQLVRSRVEAKRLIRRSFGKGFRLYDPWESLKERIYKYRLGQAPFGAIGNGIARFVWPPGFSRVLGPERGYVYFQDFLPGNDCDIRIIVIGGRAFGIRRQVRPGDFRASGSGKIAHSRVDIDENCVIMAFEAAEKLGGDCIALDFVFDRNRQPWILEVSYGFTKEGYDACMGYWDREMNWHAGRFDPCGWMVEQVATKIADEERKGS